MSPVETTYNLVDLARDQPDWFALETIPHLLAWLSNPSPPLRFQLRVDGDERRLLVTWQASRLAALVPDLATKVERLTARQSIQIEQVPQYGAYGLAGVVASALLQRRVVSLRAWSPPDLLFDENPEALSGIEVAGRGGGGFAALTTTGNEKGAALRQMADVAEAWVSMWCAKPSVSLLLKVR